jgi:hypothetical protein
VTVKPNSNLTTMATFLSSVLAGSALLQAVNAQNFGGSGGRGEDAFSWIQPMNTTILGEYGHSPAVYPSRKSTCLLAFLNTSDIVQQTSPVVEDGKQH